MKFNRLLLLGLAVAAMVSVASPAFAEKKTAEPIKVFIFTAANEGGFVDAGQKQRTDSIEDLKKALDKKDMVQIVAQSEGADITLEVLGRGGEETGSATTARGSYGTWNTSKDTVATVRVGLTAGTYSTSSKDTMTEGLQTYGIRQQTMQRRRLKSGLKTITII